MLADFAELKFAGGSGGGQIVADFIGFVPKVVVRGKLEKVEGRRLKFSVSVADARGLVAAGKITRVVVERERFMDKCT